MAKAGRKRGKSYKKTTKNKAAELNKCWKFKSLFEVLCKLRMD